MCDGMMRNVGYKVCVLLVVEWGNCIRWCWGCIVEFGVGDSEEINYEGG